MSRDARELKATENEWAEPRRHFLEHGYWSAPGLFGAPAVQRIAGWAEELASAPESADRHWNYYEQQGGARLLNRIENFEPFHRGLSELVRGPALLGSASALLGGPALLFKDKINFKLPGGGGFEPHQDSQAGWERYASWFVTAAVALDPSTAESGCLELARWPHRRELIGPLWEPLGPAALAGIEFEPLPMQPGDAVFFDSYLPHRSAANRAQRPRKLLYITYHLAREGDQRARYYADKRASFPPDCARESGKEYRYRV